MVLKYYIDEIAKRCQVTDDNEKLAFKSYVNKSIEKIFELYSELLYEETTLDTVADEKDIDLPADFWKSVVLSIDQFKLAKMSQWDLTDYIPNLDEYAKERPRLYDIIGINSSSLTTTGDITIVSDDTGDTTQKVKIYGVKDDEPVVFEATLNGTTPVTIIPPGEVDTIHFISLNGACAGKITIKEAGGPELAYITANNLSASLISYKNVLRLAPIPDAVYTIKLKYYKNIPQLENDGDYLSDLKPIFNVDIIERAYIQYLYYNGQENLASNLEQVWINQINEKINTERRLGRQDSQKQFDFNNTRAYPYDDVFDRYF